MDFKLKAYVCKNKSNNFYVCLSWYEQGEHKRKNVTLPSSIKSKSEARLASVKILNKFQKVLDRHSCDNVFNLLDSYEIKGVRENTKYKYSVYLNKFKDFIEKYAEMQGLDAIFTVDENLINLYISFLSPKQQVDTIRSEVKYLLRVFNELGLPSINVNKLDYKQCKKVKNENKRKFITNIELKNILEYFDTKDEYKYMHPIVNLCLVYGLRREEVLGLLWSDIDFDSNEMHIRTTRLKYGGKIVQVDDTKTTASKRVYSIKKLKDYFLSIKSKQVADGVYDASGNVCLDNNNKPCNVDYVTKLFKDAIRHYEYDDDLSFRALRSTCATMLLEEGLTDSQIIAYLGWTDIKTARRHYFQYTAELKEGITDKLVENIGICH